MAFYPDELSPIDQIRSLGKQTDSLPDIGPLKNRRQWKSLVLGKKDMGMNNFATITEEKEEEISSDGSQGANSNKDSAGGLTVSPGVVANKKITFPKPRKYITSRVSDRKEDTSLKGVGGSIPFSSFNSSVKETPDFKIDTKKAELSPVSNSSKSNAEETKPLLKIKKSKELVALAQNFTQNFALNETPIETQWNEAFSESPGLISWSKPSNEKINILKYDSPQGLKLKQEEKKSALKESSKTSNITDSVKREVKGNKKKGSQSSKKLSKGKKEVPSTSATDNVITSRSKQKTEKGKTLNMKEVVNVYKNLAYGSKEEIRTFVENLSLVKDESKAENDKNLLSVMNLKALESKIKNFTKKSGKNPEATTSKEKKPKAEKPIKRSRKAHIERLARHKVIKVPAVSKSNHPKNSTKAVAEGKSLEQKEKKASIKDKEPWKYVGMESILDKTYFVYPAYPPSVNLKNAVKNKKARTKETEKPVRQNKGNADVTASKTSEPETKVKGPQVVLRRNLFSGGDLRTYGLSDSGSASNKSMNRPSATTVCTVEFRPGVGQKAEEPPVGATDQSLLVYLHGTKAIHIKSPYSDRQFSRVKFFRKDERGMPLIKGLGRRAASKGCKKVSVRNISWPGKLTRVRSLDLLDFQEDIQNITDFLRSQNTSDQQRQEEWQGVKKCEKEKWPKESLKEQETASSRHQRRQRLSIHELQHFHDNFLFHHHHQHGTSLNNLSPDSIINEISKNIQHLQYLPDTEENRKMIGQFFDELDQQIEISKKGTSAFRKFPSSPSPETFRPIPILGY